MARMSLRSRTPTVGRDYAPVTSTSQRHVSEAWPVKIFFKQYEKCGLVGKAIFWAVLVSVVGTALDYGIWCIQLPWLREHVVVNTVQGIFLGVAVWIFLKAQDSRLQRRFKEVGYLNHHIRNSLVTINLAEHCIPESAQRLELITKATTRIERCIEKISRDEDCEVDQQSPQEP